MPVDSSDLVPSNFQIDYHRSAVNRASQSYTMDRETPYLQTIWKTSKSATPLTPKGVIRLKITRKKETSLVNQCITTRRELDPN